MASTGDSAPILVATRLIPAWVNASRPSACRCSAASCSVAVSVFHRSRCRTGLAGTSRTNSAVSSCFAISLSFSTSLGMLTDSCATTRERAMMHPLRYCCGPPATARSTHNLASVVCLGQGAARLHGPCRATGDGPIAPVRRRRFGPAADVPGPGAREGSLPPGEGRLVSGRAFECLKGVGDVPDWHAPMYGIYDPRPVDGAESAAEFQ